MKQKTKEDTVLMLLIILFIASLIRTEFISLFGFLIGYLLGKKNKSETWLTLK